MKRLLIIIVTMAFCALSCRLAPQRLKTGDLVFVGIPADYSLDDSMNAAITAATCPDSLNIIHAAIAEVQGDSVWIIDATIRHGVDRHPLDTFVKDFTLKDGTLPDFIVMRLKDDDNASRYVANARNFVGLKYNCTFVPCDTAQYCTELIRNSYRRSDGSYIFSEAPMNFRAPDGSMPVYWEQLFSILGQPVPQGVPGTNPRAMMAEPCLKQVNISLK